MNKVHRFLLRFYIYRKYIDLLKIITLPGFERVPVYNVIVFFLRELAREDLVIRASALAFNFFLALFPTTIFFFTFVAYLPISQSHDSILQFFSDILPKSAFESIQSTLEDILKNQHGGLLSFSMFMALYFGTNGLHSMMNAFNKYAREEDERSFLKQRLVATGLTLLLSVDIIVAVSLITFGKKALDFLYDKGFLNDVFALIMLDLSKWAIILLLFFSMISCLYYFGPSKKKKWRFFSPGSTLATILSIVTTLGFAYYVNNFSSYNKLYGSIGTLIVIMLLIYFNCIILLVGFELNSSIDKGLEKKGGRPVQRHNQLLMHEFAPAPDEDKKT